MSSIFRFFGILFLFLSIVALQLTVSNLLPYPLDKVNIIFAVLILYLLFKGSGAVVWFAAGLHLLVELYSATPFGIVLFASTFGILIVFWLARVLFTNPSPHVAAGLLVLGLVSYRVLYTLLLGLHAAIFHSLNFKLIFLLRLFAWELLCTLVVTLSLYLLFSAFIKARPLQVF